MHIQKRPIPSDVPFTKEYGHHVCNSSCVYEYDDSNKEYKKMSPLALPLHLGFTRYTFTYFYVFLWCLIVTTKILMQRNCKKSSSVNFLPRTLWDSNT